MGTKEKTNLSASKIQTLNRCSWTYHCKYLLKLPEGTNSGQLRGGICHEILELLQAKKHKKLRVSTLEHYVITEKNPIFRLARAKVKKHNLAPDDLEMITEMLLVGLKHDPFDEKRLKGVELTSTLEGETYKLKGILDKVYESPEGFEVIDYKSSKKKFSAEELKNNIQALIYALLCLKNFGKRAIVKFLFLRFPKSPEQVLFPTEEELSGLECYLGYLGEYLGNFTEKDARSDFASNDIKRSWLCGKEEEGKFCCPFRKPMVYYSLYDKDGKLISNHFRKGIGKADEYVVENTYSGCPCYPHGL